MCKLFSISETAGIPRDKLNTLLRRLNRRFLETEPDGFGWALAPHPVGSVIPKHIIERYVAPSSFAGLDGGLRTYDAEDDEAESLLDLPDADYGRELTSAQISGPLIVHGRNASGMVCIENTHPFHKQGWTLAHNGYVECLETDWETETTCDSEHLLNCFVFGDGPPQFAERLDGRYAILVLSPDNKLHVVKNAATSLWAARSKQGVWCFATDARDLFSAFKLLDFGKPVPAPVMADRHFILDRGRIVHSEDIPTVYPPVQRPTTFYQKQTDLSWRHQGSPSPTAY